MEKEWQASKLDQQRLSCEYRIGPQQNTWVLGQVIPERDSRGQIVGYLGTLTKITEQKRAQEALRVNEARFRAAFGFAPHGMSLTAPGGRFLQVNRFLCQMLGYTESELLEMRFQDITHPEDVEASVAGAKGLLENKLQSFEVEKRYLRKDGSPVWLLLRSNLIRDSDEQPLYFVSHMQDISERKRADEALRRSEEVFKLAAQATSDVVYDYEIPSDRLWFSAAFENVFGADPKSLEPGIESWTKRLHPEDRNRVIASLTASLHSADSYWTDEYRFQCADGSYAYIFDRGYFIRDLLGQAVRMVGAMMDMTERKAAEEERNRLFREVEAARDRMQMLSHRLVEVQEQERRRIARELHDEIGQELTALRLNLEQSAASSEAPRNQGLREAQALVNKLLGLVRELSLDLRPTMLDDLGLLPALLWHFDRYFAHSGIRVGFKHFGLEGRRFPAEIETAAYRIVQEALTNVLRHARAKEANVTVWVSDQNRTLAIHVDDPGVGFDVDLALNARNSSGLSGMSERAALLGGRLTIESVRGEGTCLTAELPVEVKARAHD